MNKERFIEFVENPDTVSGKDAEILAELARNYPYSSLVHILLAKARKNTDEARSSLASAALYISDRSVLKSVMENSASAKVKEVKNTPAQAPEVKKEAPVLVSEPLESREVVSPAEPVLITENSKGSDVFQELQENLQKLKDQREKFQNSGQTRQETEITREPDGQETPVAENEDPKNYTLPERLQEVVENREEKVIADPKRLEQINLINDFIKNSQSIARKYRSVNDLPEEQNDLTGNYHFTPPDLVTENLALIMVRQGKPEKAIDIYQKLVLKYPEKKAYFASCIEKLINS